MTDLLKTGSDWLAGMRRTHMARMVMIRRGDESTAAPATPGATRAEHEQDGIRVGVEHRDWLIDAADYNFGGGAVEPRRGDVIEDPGGSDTRRYEVMPLGDEPCWRWHDRYGTTLRIHTRYTGTG